MTEGVVDSVKDVAVVLLEIGTGIAVDKRVDVGSVENVEDDGVDMSESPSLGAIPAPINKFFSSIRNSSEK